MAMQENDLKYASLSRLLKPIQKETGLGESASFLIWFLENVYRLEESDARDAVCDQTNDKGIDGIYVDHNNEEIHFFQAKIRQNDNGRIGDKDPKSFMGSVHQFDTKEKIELVLESNADVELKNLLTRLELSHWVLQGYEPVGVYVTNELHNQDSELYASLTPDIKIYDRSAIALRVISVSHTRNKREKFTFDTSYVDPMEMTIGADGGDLRMFIFPAKALQLVHMTGIADGSLFRENVRFSLGNTGVNKSIRNSLSDKKNHPNFILGHNGIIVLCSSADTSEEGKLSIEDYSVVNGAQSLTSFFNEKSKLSDDLRVLVRVVEVQDESLARRITENSNNQNAIKPRDLRSNHLLQRRLQEEMAQLEGNFFFEIKRGEEAPNDSVVISNDEIGRALLAFDLGEPWSAHQIYKVFDEKYNQIFGRPEVTAVRVIFMYRLLELVDNVLPDVASQPMASYKLTRYFLLYLLSRILRKNDASNRVVADPSILPDEQLDKFYSKCEEILGGAVVDLNYEAEQPDFDYKSVLKSPKQVESLTSDMLRSYDKDVKRNKAESFSDWDVSDWEISE